MVTAAFLLISTGLAGYWSARSGSRRLAALNLGWPFLLPVFYGLYRTIRPLEPTVRQPFASGLAVAALWALPALGAVWTVWGWSLGL